MSILDKLRLEITDIQIEIPREEYMNQEMISFKLLVQYIAVYDLDKSDASAIDISCTSEEPFSLGVIMAAAYKNVREKLLVKHEVAPKTIHLKHILVY